jgi:glycosyltransferase involved in cell wall biosynthesis
MYAAVSAIPGIELLPVNFGQEHGVRSGRGRLVQGLGDWPTIPSMVRLATHIRRRRIPIIHTVSRPRDALVCVLLAKVTRTKCLIHMQLGWGQWMSRSLRWSLRQADGLIAISDFVAQTLLDSGHRPERIYHAYNAVVLEDWKPAEDRTRVREELGLSPCGPLVVSVSRLFKEKGTAELLRAMALVRKEIPDVRLVVVGQDVTGGSFMRELQTIIDEEQLHGCVTFVGQRSDVVRFMAAADVFAMPSSEEPFGIVFAEAMAMELPVVALNNGGTPEVVPHERAGLLSDRGDVKALAVNLTTILRDAELRSQMGAYGREEVKKRFTVEQLADAMGEIYERVVR